MVGTCCPYIDVSDAPLPEFLLPLLHPLRAAKKAVLLSAPAHEHDGAPRPPASPQLLPHHPNNLVLGSYRKYHSKYKIEG